MRLRAWLGIVAGILLGLCCSPNARAQASPLNDRLPRVIDAGEAREALPQGISARALQAVDLGPADTSRQLTGLSLRFTMSAAQSAALEQLLEAQQEASSPLFHQWLTPEQFGARFGLSADDLASVSAWVQAQGFTVTGVARGGSFVQFRGTVGQANQAFGVTLHRVSWNGEQHIANVAPPSLPAALAAVVGGITGLDDFRPAPHHRFRSVAAPAYTVSTSDGTHFIAPGDFYTIYDIQGLLNSGVNGTGMKIAVMGQVAISQTDVSAFRSASGLSTSNLPTTTTYGAAPAAPTANGTPSDDDEIESELDVEWSGAVAPDATILFVNGQDVFDNAMTGAIDNDIAPILSVSYGACESDVGNSTLSEYNALFLQANAQGQTIVASAGDSGATTCDGDAASIPTLAKRGLSVDFPADSPAVTGVGGTTYNEGTGTYWNTANGTNSGSAVSYIPELPWNDSFLSSASCAGPDELCGLSAGGGGVSTYFAKPTWQTGTGVPPDGMRDVPDVAFAADPDHDGYLICALGSCTNGYAAANGSLSIVGGTSVPTPAFAGILALLEEKLQTSLGNANPGIYAVANSTYAAAVFHDITSGTNASPCQANSTGCAADDTGYFAAGTLPYPVYSGPTGDVPVAAIGYTAHAGYDQTTGWGSMDVGNLLADWTLATKMSAPQTPVASVTTLTSSSNSVTQGAAITLSASVVSGSATETVAPTGSVQLEADGTDTGSAVTLVAGAAVFPSYSTTGLSVGSHTFSAVYSGDGTYNASTGTVTVTITAVTAADTPNFTLSPTTAGITVSSGGVSSGLTITVAPVNGFTGNVVFSAQPATSGLAAAYTFSTNPVVLSGIGTGSTVLTVNGYEAAMRSAGIFARFAPGDRRGMPGTGVAGSGAALAGLLLLLLPDRRRRWPALAALLMVCAGATALAGCGSGGSTAASTKNAAPGTYTVVVTAIGSTASGAQLTQALNVTLTVE